MMSRPISLYLPISTYISLCISLYLDAHGGGEETDENEHEDDRQAHPHAEADPADVVLGLVAHGLRDGVLALRVDGVGGRGMGRVRGRGRGRVRVRVRVRTRMLDTDLLGVELGSRVRVRV